MPGTAAMYRTIGTITGRRRLVKMFCGLAPNALALPPRLWHQEDAPGGIMKGTVLHTAIGCVIGLAVSATIRTSLVATSQPPAGRGRGLAFTEPSPLDFADHEGYVSIFDGKTLGGWDGNPKFWRVEDGAIVGESTPERPSGNSYIAYRRLLAKDFTAKFEIKVEGTGG